MTSSVPSPRAVAGWFASLVEEVVRAPSTLRDARIALKDVRRVAEQLEAFGAPLERTTGALEAALSQLSAVVAGQMRDTLTHLDGSVSDLRDTLTGVVGVIPGARRALQGVVRPQRGSS